MSSLEQKLDGWKPMCYFLHVSVERDSKLLGYSPYLTLHPNALIPWDCFRPGSASTLHRHLDPNQVARLCSSFPRTLPARAQGTAIVNV